MSQNTEPDVARFEARIQAAAQRYLTNANKQSCCFERADRVLKNLVSVDSKPPNSRTLYSSISSQLATERRWAKVNHPKYDVNRHLALIEAINYLETEQQRHKEQP